MRNKKIKAWAIITNKGGTIIGGGDKYFGYVELCIYRTRIGAKEHLRPTRNDIIVPVEIKLLSPNKK